MPLDPQIQTLLDQLSQNGGVAPESQTVAANRAAGAFFTTLGGQPVAVGSVRDGAVPADGRDIPVRIYTPEGSTNGGLRPVTVFFHGGGWVFGDLDSQDHIARTLARRSGTIVVSVDYRLAPEDRFPAAVDDAYAALEWVAGHAATFGGDRSRIALFGESAGANLAAVTAQEVKRRGGPRVMFQALAYPATDRFDDSPSMYENASGPLLTRSWMEWFWGCYLTTPDQGADTRVSPLRSDDLAGLAPAMVVTAEFDPLRDQGDLYAAKLAAAGVPVAHVPVPGATHAFLSFTGSVQIARDTLDQLGGAISAAFATDK
jgi:acetyl esterase